MALQSSGAISLNEIHIEAGGTTGTSASINDADIRALIGKSSGATMSFSEWYGASASYSFPAKYFEFRSTTNGVYSYSSYYDHVPNTNKYAYFGAQHGSNSQNQGIYRLNWNNSTPSITPLFRSKLYGLFMKVIALEDGGFALFGPSKNFAGSYGLEPQANTDILLEKFNSSGTRQWGYKIITGSSLNNQFMSFFAFAEGNHIYVGAGQTGMTGAVLGKINHTTNSWVWKKKLNFDLSSRTINLAGTSFAGDDSVFHITTHAYADHLINKSDGSRNTSTTKTIVRPRLTTAPSGYNTVTTGQFPVGIDRSGNYVTVLTSTGTGKLDPNRNFLFYNGNFSGYWSLGNNFDWVPDNDNTGYWWYRIGSPNSRWRYGYFDSNNVLQDSFNLEFRHYQDNVMSPTLNAQLCRGNMNSYIRQESDPLNRGFFPFSSSIAPSTSVPATMVTANIDSRTGQGDNYTFSNTTTWIPNSTAKHFGVRRYTSGTGFGPFNDGGTTVPSGYTVNTSQTQNMIDNGTTYFKGYGTVASNQFVSTTATLVDTTSFTSFTASNATRTGNL